ncbi:hypothetical protein [Nocardia sp. NPDC004415]
MNRGKSVRPEDAARAAALADAYRRGKGPVAFLDESYQIADGTVRQNETFYVLTAVIVRIPDMDELRENLLAIVGSSYWHSTEALRDGGSGPDIMRAMLEYLSEGVEPVMIAHRVSVAEGDKDGEAARRDCYRSLAVELSRGGTGRDPVELLVLEERNQSNLRNRDKRNHRDLVSEQLIGRNSRLVQTSPRYETLLWLPDVVSSAYRRSLTHRDETSTMFDIVRDYVEFVTPQA